MKCRAAALAPALIVTLAMGGGWSPAAALAGGGAAGLQHAPKTPVHHFVTLLQENHTFDSYFGTYPGADGIPANVCVPVNPAAGATPCVRPFHIGNQSILDLDHSGSSARTDLGHGRMNGFVEAQNIRTGDGTQAMGYYNASDIPFYWNVADRYVLFDHFFSADLGGSFLNHVYWVAAGAGNASQSVPAGGLKLTTIFDRLEQAGVSWKFYVQNYDPSINYRSLPHLTNANRASQAVWCPLLDIPRFLDDPALRSHIAGLSRYYYDLRHGTLPAVSFIAPSGASEHPPGSLVTGQRFVRGLVNALMTSTAWDSSVFLEAYDDWGGWYDHVLPPWRHGHQDGFRVPALLISPYARRHFIDHTSLDFMSMLRFTEQNWSLRPLTQLDASAGSIMGAFDFSGPPRKPAIIPLQRTTPPARQTVRDTVLYSLYGLGVVLAGALILLATRRSRPRLVAVRTGRGPA